MTRLVLSDVDGTLVRSDKSLSERSIEAVGELHAAGIRFAVTSGRPPRGMSMLVDEPTVVDGFDGIEAGVAKIVGVSDDHDAVAAAAERAHAVLGDHVSASRSQPYYLDVTHPRANKGAVAQFLSRMYDIEPDEIATIGDMPNDVRMFAHSGLSIAMGNADREVRRAARRVTTSNDDDGFAHAIERFILREGSD